MSASDDITQLPLDLLISLQQTESNSDARKDIVHSAEQAMRQSDRPRYYHLRDAGVYMLAESASVRRIRHTVGQLKTRAAQQARQKELAPAIKAVRGRDSAFKSGGWRLCLPDGRDITDKLDDGTISNMVMGFEVIARPSVAPAARSPPADISRPRPPADEEQKDVLVPGNPAQPVVVDELAPVIVESHPPSSVTEQLALIEQLVIQPEIEPSNEVPEPQPDPQPPVSPAPDLWESSDDDGRDPDWVEDTDPETDSDSVVSDSSDVSSAGSRKRKRKCRRGPAKRPGRVPLREQEPVLRDMTRRTNFDGLCAILSHPNAPHIFCLYAPCKSGKSKISIAYGLVALRAGLVDRVVYVLGITQKHLKDQFRQDAIDMLGEEVVERHFLFLHLPDLLKLGPDSCELKRTWFVVDEAHWALGENTELSKWFVKLGIYQAETLVNHGLFLLFVSATPGSLQVDLEELGPDMVRVLPFIPGPGYVPLEALLASDKFHDEAGPFDPVKPITTNELKYGLHLGDSYRVSETLEQPARFDRALELIDEQVDDLSRPLYHWMRVGIGHKSGQEDRSVMRKQFKNLLAHLLKRDRLKDFAIICLDSRMPDNCPFDRKLNTSPTVALKQLRQWSSGMRDLIQASNRSQRDSKWANNSLHVAVNPDCANVIVLVARFHHCGDHVCTDHIGTWFDRYTQDPAGQAQSTQRMSGYLVSQSILIVACRRQLQQHANYKQNGNRYSGIKYQSPSLQSRGPQGQKVLKHTSFQYEKMTLPVHVAERAKLIREENTLSYDTGVPTELRLQLVRSANQRMHESDSFVLKYDHPDHRALRANLADESAGGTNIIVVALAGYSDWRDVCMRVRELLGAVEVNTQWKQPPMAGHRSNLPCKLLPSPEPATLQKILFGVNIRWRGHKAHNLSGFCYDDHERFTGSLPKNLEELTRDSRLCTAFPESHLVLVVQQPVWRDVVRMEEGL